MAKKGKALYVPVDHKLYNALRTVVKKEDTDMAKKTRSLIRKFLRNDYPELDIE